MDKTQLRNELRQILARMPEAVRQEKSRQVCGYLLGADDYKRASVVMVFLSMPGEVDTTPILLDAWQQGKTVVVPQVLWDRRHMIPVEIRSLKSGLDVDKKGLRNPTAGEPVPYEEIDLVIVPGLGFDRQCNRLGRGGAYYDRFFTSPGLGALKWAVAFSEQIVDAIPHDEHDMPVDALICEAGFIRQSYTEKSRRISL
jgi:5-formyltetrahydrofolate cyclo-ligase